MCGNRVEELESRVKELEASIKGLTDELVECKVRIRELESATDEDIGFIPSGEQREAGAEESQDSVESSAEATKAEAVKTEDNTEESDSDIIVA